MQIWLFRCLSEGVFSCQYVLKFKNIWIWSEGGRDRFFLTISRINKPSFCSGSCDDWHTTTTKQTFFERLLICFKPPLKTSLKDARNALETSLTSLKYLCNYIEKSLYLPWNIHHWNFLENFVKFTWNFFKNLLETCLSHNWNLLETPLKHFWNTI